MSMHSFRSRHGGDDAQGLQGGMMEEWHQKLHNNSSPDDIIICKALLAYLESDQDISQYWAVLSVSCCPRRQRLSSQSVYNNYWQ